MYFTQLIIIINGVNSLNQLIFIGLWIIKIYVEYWWDSLNWTAMGQKLGKINITSCF